MPRPSTEDTSGARLHNEHRNALRCTLTVQLDIVQSFSTSQVLHVLHTLPFQANMLDTYSPNELDMISNPHDAHETHNPISCFSTSFVKHPKLCPPNMRVYSCVDAACQGGDVSKMNCIIFVMQHHPTATTFKPA
eukprot:53363-Pelagomonas_calceolata.AAC.1